MHATPRRWLIGSTPQGLYIHRCISYPREIGPGPFKLTVCNR
ncbi:hypothetical protein [Enterobacter phage vB_EclM_AS6]